MNINPEHNFENDDIASAEEVIDNGMDFIFQTLIKPMQSKLSVDDLQMLSIIGVAFKIVADQATAYEKAQQDETNQQDFFRN